MPKRSMKPAPAELPVSFTKPLILCVEDDPIYLHLRKAVLQNEGYGVIGVTNTDDALRALYAERARRYAMPLGGEDELYRSVLAALPT